MGTETGHTHNIQKTDCWDLHSVEADEAVNISLQIKFLSECATHILKTGAESIKVNQLTESIWQPESSRQRPDLVTRCSKCMIEPGFSYNVQCD